MPLTAEMIAEIDRHYPGLDDARRGAELERELISYLIGGGFLESRRRLELAQPKSVDDVPNHGGVRVAFPPAVPPAAAETKSFLNPPMYHHPRVNPGSCPT